MLGKHIVFIFTNKNAYFYTCSDCYVSALLPRYIIHGRCTIIFLFCFRGMLLTVLFFMLSFIFILMNYLLLLFFQSLEDEIVSKKVLRLAGLQCWHCLSYGRFQVTCTVLRNGVECSSSHLVLL